MFTPQKKKKKLKITRKKKMNKGSSLKNTCELSHFVFGFMTIQNKQKISLLVYNSRLIHLNIPVLPYQAIWYGTLILITSLPKPTRSWDF